MNFDLIGFYFFILIIGVILASIPIAILYLVFKWLNKKGFKWIGLLIILISVSFFVYEIFTAIYPEDRFYFDEFKKVTSLEIPKSAEVLDKTASYPDFHGDYISCSIIKLSKEDYNALLNTLTKDTTIIKNPGIGGSEELDKIKKTRNISDIKRSFSRKIPGKDYFTYIGFFKDGESVLVYFVNP
ncbi:MAG: hypothetical protein V4520_02200 [Bacteroidota bacterium]